MNVSCSLIVILTLLLSSQFAMSFVSSFLLGGGRLTAITSCANRNMAAGDIGFISRQFPVESPPGQIANNNASTFHAERIRAPTLLKQTEKRFRSAGIDEPYISAKWLLTKVLSHSQLSDPDFIAGCNTYLHKTHLEQFEKLCNERLKSKPVQHIVGEWDFHSINLKMKEPIFIPRPETEEMVDLILSQIDPFCDEKLLFLDIGSGTGAIGLALLAMLPNSICIAIDVNPEAVNLSTENAKHLALADRYECHLLSVQEIQQLWQKRHKFWNILIENQTFDFVVSNPPYISRDEIIHLQPEIRLYEDHKALDGGDDGLNLVREIIKITPSILSSGSTNSKRFNGSLWLELDSTQPAKIEQELQIKNASLTVGHTSSSSVLEKKWFKIADVMNDYTNRPRFMRLQLHA